MAFRGIRDVVSLPGTVWDDEAHVNVAKIRIAHNDFGITLVQFDYIDDLRLGTVVNGPDHGREPLNFEHGGVPDPNGKNEEFLLAADEYINTVITYRGYCVTKIKFYTNKRVIECGADLESLHRTESVIYKRSYGGFYMGRNIVGFHGKSGPRYLYEFGVYLH